MTVSTEQQAFEATARHGAPAARAMELCQTLAAGGQGAPELAALWLHVAAAHPDQLPQIYDASAEGWFGARPKAQAIDARSAPLPIPADFWPQFWALASDPRTGQDAGEVTVRTAALAGSLGPAYRQRAAQMSLNYPGVKAAAAAGYPAKFTLEALARNPRGSLGAQFHDLIVDNGFDLEVLDRDALGLQDLPPPLDYLNVRILQCHDLWHILAGYETTVLHEVAISGFQMGQFGHPYSAMFLAVVLTKIAFEQPAGVKLMLDTILSAWTHGRESPPLLGLDWPSLWHLTTDDLRARIGLSAYLSPYPADLFEQLRAA